MTTSNPKPETEAATIAGKLSAEEIETLQIAKAHKFINGSRTTANLRKLCELDGLLTAIPHTEEGLLTDYSITDLGKRVLEVSRNQPAGKPEGADTFVPNKAFADMTPEELDRWHAEEYFTWNGETVEETALKADGVVLPEFLVNMSFEQRQAFVKSYNTSKSTPPTATPAAVKAEGDTPIEYTTDWAEAWRKGAIKSKYEPQTQAELCEREIVKIRELTLHDDKYTGDLLGYAVGSPVGITMCVEARMKQIEDLESEIRSLRSLCAEAASRIADGVDVTFTSKGKQLSPATKELVDRLRTAAKG